MTIQRVNPAGWDYKDPVTHPQINELDENVSHAVDGVGGGQYVPTAPIDIQGEGFGGKVSGETHVSGPNGELVVDSDSGGITYRDGQFPRLEPPQQEVFAQPLVVTFNGRSGVSDGSPTFHFFPGYGLQQVDNNLPVPTMWLAFTRLPRRGIIRSLRLWVTGMAFAFEPHGDFGDLVLPSMRLLTVAPSGLFLEVGAETSDPSSNLTEYEEHHAIDVTGINLQLSPNLYPVLRVTGESGLAATPGAFSVHGLEVTCDIDEIRP